MRYVLQSEVADTVSVVREGPDVMLDLNPQWSLDLALQLLEQIREHITAGLPVQADAAGLHQLKIHVVRHLIWLTRAAELFKFGDGYWYRLKATSPRVTYHDCGGPSGRCNCTHDIETVSELTLNGPVEPTQ